MARLGTATSTVPTDPQSSRGVPVCASRTSLSRDREGRPVRAARDNYRSSRRPIPGASRRCCQILGVLACVLTACGEQRAGTGSSAMSPVLQSQPLRAVVESNDTVAVLLYSPATCFTCGAGLARWNILKAEGAPVMLVLTREPSRVESRRLRLAKVRADAVVASHSLPDAMDALFVHGELVMADTLVGGEPRRVLELFERARGRRD